LLGSKRILFGTDGPLVAFHPSIGQLMDAELTEEEREDISWRNADRLYLGGRYEKI
jgi:predicted TIM-barrel fold metal-dependent hydrolase